MIRVVIITLHNRVINHAIAGRMMMRGRKTGTERWRGRERESERNLVNE